jgi:hypothetical protein
MSHRPATMVGAATVAGWLGHIALFRFANAPHQVTHIAVASVLSAKNPAPTVISHISRNCILNGIKLLSNRNKKSIWKRTQHTVRRRETSRMEALDPHYQANEL